MTMQFNFQTMSKKELRSYLLAHRDDDSAFYAYADRVYDSVATVEVAIFEWSKPTISSIYSLNYGYRHRGC